MVVGREIIERDGEAPASADRLSSSRQGSVLHRCREQYTIRRTARNNSMFELPKDLPNTTQYEIDQQTHPSFAVAIQRF